MGLGTGFRPYDGFLLNGEKEMFKLTMGGTENFQKITIIRPILWTGFSPSNGRNCQKLIPSLLWRTSGEQSELGWTPSYSILKSAVPFFSFPLTKVLLQSAKLGSRRTVKIFDPFFLEESMNIRRFWG